MPALKELNLFENFQYEEGLAAVGQITTLEDLNLQQTPTNDTTIAGLATLKNLKKLNLEDSFIGDEAIDTVVKLPKLEVLILNGTQVSDDGLKKLTALKSLKELGIRYISASDENAGRTESGDSGVEDCGGLKLKTRGLNSNRLSGF